MTTARRPARRRTCRPRRRRLPRITIGAGTAAAVVLIAAIRTWPIPAIIFGALGATMLITREVNRRSPRPRRVPHRIPRTRVLSLGDSRTLAGFLAMSSDQFEHAVAALARQDPAVRSAAVYGGTADRGLDVLVTLHDNRRILIQCKRYATGNNVGGGTVREIVGSVITHRCAAGVIVTTAGFTAEALATNRGLGPNRLTLVDGSALVAWANGDTAPWQ